MKIIYQNSLSFTAIRQFQINDIASFSTFNLWGKPHTHTNEPLLEMYPFRLTVILFYRCFMIKWVYECGRNFIVSTDQFELHQENEKLQEKLPQNTYHVIYISVGRVACWLRLLSLDVECVADILASFHSIFSFYFLFPSLFLIYQDENSVETMNSFSLLLCDQFHKQNRIS